ncbi:MAG: PadR family transcriptional regulator [Oscillospiraceae bacterium]
MNAQFKKGVLELCVLSLLKKGDKYGYELADTVGKNIDISEGTIYPLLKRLRAEGYFEVYLKESSSGPARKYYKLTKKGEDTQVLLAEEWQDFTKNVSVIIGGINNDKN